MALSEDQVLRFSRQILVPEIGGQGQQTLLESGVRAMGAGPAHATAIAYLAASGCPISAAERQVVAGEEGFLFRRKDVGRSYEAALRDALEGAGQDGSDGSVAGIGEMPASFSGPGPWVAMGGRAGRGEIVHRSQSGCAECFQQNVAELTRAPQPISVLTGTLGALVFQRLRLGLCNPLGRIRVEESGAMSEMEVLRCAGCR